MNCPLLDIEAFCGGISSIGGLQRVALIDPLDVSGPIRQFCDPSIPEIALLTGKRSYTMQPVFSAASFTERKVIGQRAGDYYESTVALSIRGTRLEADRLAERLKNRRIHVVAFFQNGSKRLLVNARASDESMSGERRSERAGHRFTFSTRRAKKAPALLGYISSGMVDFSGNYHLFFRDAASIWHRLTIEPDGAMLTMPADPNQYSNVIQIAPPFGISVSEMGAIITP